LSTPVCSFENQIKFGKIQRKERVTMLSQQINQEIEKIRTDKIQGASALAMRAINVMIF